MHWKGLAMILIDEAMIWFRFWTSAGDKWIPCCYGQPVADYSSAADIGCWGVAGYIVPLVIVDALEAKL